jgi:DNA-binding beta-propeller fold protein YncE
LTGRWRGVRWGGIPYARTLIPLLAAVMLSVGTAHASAEEPYVVYTANQFVNGAVVLRHDPATGSLVEISRNGPQGSLFQRPYDLAVEADGGLVIADMGQQNQKDGAVIRVDPVTGRQTLLSSGGLFYDPAGIAVAPDGTLYVVDSFPGPDGGAVIRVDPNTGAQQLIGSDFDGNLFDLSFGIAVDRDGSLIVVNRSLAGELPLVCGLAGSVIRINPVTREHTLISSVLGSLLAYPVGVAIAPDGDIVVANECEGLLRTGLVRLVPNVLQAPLTTNDTTDVLRTPERVAFTPAGDLLVSDFNLGSDSDGGIVKVSRASGAQSVLASGALFNHPMGIAAVANRPPAPALAATPALVAAGRAVNLDASGSRDPEGLRLVYEWDLDGDGGFEAGSGTTATAMPRFATDGVKTMRVRVNDPHGGRAVAEARVTVDGSRPILTRLRAVARVLGVPARRGRGSSAAARRSPPRATTIRFSLSEAATVTLAIDRARSGRRPRGRACSPRAKRGRRCTAWSPVRTLRRSGSAGQNRTALRARGLRPGRYRLTLTATDAVGNRSQRRALAFRVVALRR